MIDVAVLRALAASGATVEMIIAAVEAAQASEMEKLAERRERDRKRKQKQRSCHAESVGQGGTRWDSEIKKDVSPTPPSEKIPLAKKTPLTGGQKKVSPACQNGSKPMPLSKAFENYNLMAGDLGLPIAQKLTPERQRHLRARLQEHGIQHWNEMLYRLSESDFLCGRNGRAWRANFDWLCKPTNFNKVIEGSYANTEEAVQ